MSNFPNAVPSFSTKSDGPGNPINAAHVNGVQDEIVEIGTDLISGLRRPLRLEPSTEYTIATGAITVAKGDIRVDTEANAASDDLDTITPGTNVGDGSIIFLRAENVARVVTLKDGTGNLLLNGDYALSATDRTITLKYDGTNWREIARSVQASVAAALTLLAANSGTSTAAGATTVDSVAISGLTAKDTLIVEMTLASVTQQTADPQLYHVTDGALIVHARKAGAAIASGSKQLVTAKIRQGQSGATAVYANSSGSNDGSASGIEGEWNNFVASTNWTGAWTLGLRHTGVTAGGTFQWSWAVYKLAGQ